MRTSGVAPRVIYPPLSALDEAFLSAASSSDAAAFGRVLATAAEYSHLPLSRRPPNASLNLNAHHPKTGATVLHILAANGALEMLNSLLAWTALYSSRSHSTSLSFAGLDLNARASNHSTPLHWACGSGHTPIVLALLHAGADASLRCVTWNHTVFGRGSGQTPAHWAAESGHTHCIAALASYAPMVLVMRDERNATPKETAEKAAMKETVKYIAQAEDTEYVCVELGVEWSEERWIQ
jgi:ankyrin repeat protein